MDAVQSDEAVKVGVQIWNPVVGMKRGGPEVAVENVVCTISTAFEREKLRTKIGEAQKVKNKTSVPKV